MTPQLAFQPVGSFTAPPVCSAQIEVTTSVQALTLPVSNIVNGTMRLVVSGTSNVAWCYGDNPELTMANGVVMLADTVEVFALPSSVGEISVIGASTGSTFIASAGDGQ